MRYVRPSKWPWALGGYLLAGVAPAALDPLLRWVFLKWNLPPSAATVALVNILLPLLFVLTAVFYPRPVMVVPGVALALVGACVTRTMYVNPQPWQWTMGVVLARVHPITVVATICSGAIALAACFSTQPLRRVGRPPDPCGCHHCGYTLDDEMLQCPECGEVRP